MGEGLEELLVGPELQGDDEGCEEVESVLSREDWGEESTGDDDEVAGYLEEGPPPFCGLHHVGGGAGAIWGGGHGDGAKR
jgi:hypothetical protein